MLENLIMKKESVPKQQAVGFFDVGINAFYDDPYNVSMSSDGTRAIFGQRALYTSGAFNILRRVNSVCVVEKTQANPTASYSAEYGSVVGISGDGILAFSSNPGYTTSYSGAVYIYKRTTTSWALMQLLTEPVGAAANNTFGASVKISRDALCLVVGSPGKTSGKGAAYALRRTTGNFSNRTTLISPDGAAGHRFGERVAISDNGNRIVVASPGNSALYVFTSTGAGWDSVEKISNVPIAAIASLCISEDGTMIAAGITGFNSNAGKVMLFKYINYTWSLIAEVTETNPVANHYFGKDVVLRTGNSSPKLYVSANAPEAVIPEGNIYVYPIGSQTVEPCSKTLTGNAPSERTDGLFYSFDVSLDGKTVSAVTRPGNWVLRTSFYENV